MLPLVKIKAEKQNNTKQEQIIWYGLALEVDFIGEQTNWTPKWSIFNSKQDKYKAASYIIYINLDFPCLRQSLLIAITFVPLPLWKNHSQIWPPRLSFVSYCPFIGTYGINNRCEDTIGQKHYISERTWVTTADIEHPAVYQFIQFQPWLWLNAVIDNGRVISSRKQLSSNNKHCLRVKNHWKCII